MLPHPPRPPPPAVVIQTWPTHISPSPPTPVLTRPQNEDHTTPTKLVNQEETMLPNPSLMAKAWAFVSNTANKPPTQHDTEAKRHNLLERRRDGCYFNGRKIHTRKLLLLIIVVVAFYVIWSHVSRIISDPRALRLQSIQPALEVPPQYVVTFTVLWRPRLREYLQQHPHSMGVCSSYIRQYHRYLLMKSNHTLVGMFNPTWTPDPQSKIKETIEVSLLCRDQTHYSQMSAKRHNLIRVSYLSEHGETAEATLRDSEAYVLQHMVDVMDGHWLCPDQGRQSNIPAYGDHIYDPELIEKLYLNRTENKEEL